MLRSEKEDLQSEILDFKRQLCNYKTENQMLKVKIRKLEDNVNKKEKLIENFLNPTKSNTIRKLIAERGVIMMMKLKDENDTLKKIIKEKDTQLRKLQNNIKSYKLYKSERTKNTVSENQPPLFEVNVLGSFQVTPEKFRSRSENNVNPEMKTVLPQSIVILNENASQEDMLKSETSSQHEHQNKCLASTTPETCVGHRHLKYSYNSELSCTDTDNTSDLGFLSSKKFLSILEAVINAQTKEECISASAVDNSFLKPPQINAACSGDCGDTSVHLLQCCVVNMLKTIDRLKSTIDKLQNQQKQTMQMLLQKDITIVNLTQEIKALKDAKPVFKKKTKTNNQIKMKKKTKNFSCEKYQRSNSEESINRHLLTNSNSTIVSADSQLPNKFPEKFTTSPRDTSKHSTGKLKNNVDRYDYSDSFEEDESLVEKKYKTEPDLNLQTQLDKKNRRDNHLFTLINKHLKAFSITNNHNNDCDVQESETN